MNLRNHGVSFQKHGNRKSHVIQDGRSQINVGCRGGNHLCGLAAFDYERNVADLLIGRRIFPLEPVGAQHISVIRGKDHKGVRHLILNHLQNSSDLIVHKGIAA